MSFCTALAKLVKSQKPEVRALDIHALIDLYGPDSTMAKISSVTVWKLMCLLGRIFKFATTIEVISRNPVPGAIPKKGEFNAREAWSRRDVADIFSRPMFIGFEGQDRGHRDVQEAGSLKTLAIGCQYCVSITERVWKSLGSAGMRDR